VISGRTLQRGICSTFFVALLCLMPAFFCSGNNPVKTVAHYKVSSRGFTIGDVTTTQRRTEEAGVTSVQFETRTAVKASFLWMGYLQDTIEQGIVQNGNLVSYSRKGSENGDTFGIEGRLENTSFRFDVHGQGLKRTIVIPRDSYDYSTMECPEARLDFSKNKPVTLRILDVEKMAVVSRTYELVRNAHYSVAGKEHPCRVVDYSDQNKKARRWIALDGSTVVMYRQDGRGDKNPYSVQATSVTRGL